MVTCSVLSWLSTPKESRPKPILQFDLIEISNKPIVQESFFKIAAYTFRFFFRISKRCSKSLTGLWEPSLENGESKHCFNFKKLQVAKVFLVTEV